jgi:Flp pilus assembly secretin CpaC
MSVTPARNPTGRILHRMMGVVLMGVVLAAAVLAAGAACAADHVTVVLDQATVVKMPEKVSTVVVGNPLIADVSLQPGGIMVLTGKGFGMTNVLALDRAGNILMEKSVQVHGPRDDVVVVYRGVLQESYSCAPKCERRVTLGDAPAHFDAALGQIMTRSGTAQGQALPK